MFVVILLGGGEQHILNVLDNIDRERYKIDVLLPDDRCEREYELESKNTKVIKYNCASFRKK